MTHRLWNWEQREVNLMKEGRRSRLEGHREKSTLNKTGEAGRSREVGNGKMGRHE